jgi:ribonuclease Z
LLLALLGAAFAVRVPIGSFLFDRAVKARVGQDALAPLPDGLHIGLCGTGSPLPDPDRAGPCTFIRAGKRLFLVDVGGGAVRQLGEMGVQIGQIDGIFLTHFHSDHFDGLSEAMLLRWTGGGHATPLPVYGGAGVERIVDGLNMAYALDADYRVAHHGADIVPPSGKGGRAVSFALETDTDQAVVYEGEGLQVTAIRVKHDPVAPAFGYRFDYKGRSALISGDTAYTPVLAKACNGCDLLVHEALNPEMVAKIGGALKKRGNKRLAKIMSDIPGYHASPVEAARTAHDGKAKMLVLTHIVPALPSKLLEAYFVNGTTVVYDGPIIVGHDRMLFSLPAGKAGIVRKAL